MKPWVLIPCVALMAAFVAAPRDKKKKHDQEEEPRTQELQLPPELPSATTADADRLVFQVTPLRSDGLLTQQLREAMKSLLRQDRPIVKLRAFVAGTGDTRRVQTVVSELCSDKRVPLPTLTVVQVGQLPREGAQVVLESVAVDKKAVNPNGVAMVPAESDYGSQPLEPVLPHLKRVLERLRASLATAGAGPDEVLATTCYTTSLEEADQLRGAVNAAFPKAASDFVQPLRAPLDSGATCEAVGRLVAPQPQGPGKLVFTSAQMAFGTTAADANLAFERLGKTLAQAGASYAGIRHMTIFSLSRSTGDLAARAAGQRFDPARQTALTVLAVEGLPSLDASFTSDAVAFLSTSK